MATEIPATAVGVFGDRVQADQAIRELRAAGFADTDIGIGARRADPDTGPPTWESGAAVGGMSGAALGGLAAGPVGLLGGTLVGMLLGTLIDLGVSEDEARWYTEQAHAGRTVVTVRVHGRYREAHEILLRHGGHETPPV